ncbi:MAG: tetratricopeptide repeat protein [Candidatus Thorarchaeota archaeon]|nr:tetratricopeptide repeat protein [Candidatus Thorarchaeota archaeon]
MGTDRQITGDATTRDTGGMDVESCLKRGMELKDTKPDEALEAFIAAVEKDPMNRQALTEICILLLKMRREVDAEKWGKRLLALDPSVKKTWPRLRSELREGHVRWDAPAEQVSSASRSTTTARTVETTWLKAVETTRAKPADAGPADTGSGKTVPERTDRPSQAPSPSRQASSKQPTSVEQPRESTWCQPLAETKTPRMPDDQSPRSAPGTGTIMTPVLKSERTEQSEKLDKLVTLGDVSMKRGMFRDAEVSYRQALALDESNVQARVGLALALVEMKKFKEAKQFLEGLANEGFVTKEVLYGRGMCAYADHEFSDAATILSRYTQFDKGKFQAWVALGRSYYEIGQNREAGRALLQALTMNPDSPEALLYFGLALVKEGHMERAASVLIKMVELEDRDAARLEKAADALTLTGNHGAAGKAKAKALELARRAAPLR